VVCVAGNYMIDEMLRYDAKERALTLNSCAILAFLVGKLR